MRQRQQVAQVLRPHRHALEREHESGQQHVGQEIKHGQLHGLQLVLRQRRQRDAHGQVRRHEEQRRQVHGQQAAQDRHMKYEVRGQQDDGGLDQPDGDVGHDLAGHDL
ncbi:hypothetical protein D3C85_1420990 [compost metagenome]